MKPKGYIELTEANNSQTIMINGNVIFAVYYSVGNKATHIASIGGNVIPVKESKELVMEMLSSKSNKEK